MDETFFRKPFKGKKKGLPRPARKRGNDKKGECRKIPVMVARDKSNQNVDGILENESADELCHHLNGRINIETVVCADASLAHEKLARTLGFTFKELVSFSGKRVIEVVFHCVATKYLPHYHGWRRVLTGINALTSDQIVNKILQFVHFQPLKTT